MFRFFCSPCVACASGCLRRARSLRRRPPSRGCLRLCASFVSPSFAAASWGAAPSFALRRRPRAPRFSSFLRPLPGGVGRVVGPLQLARLALFFGNPPAGGRPPFEPACGPGGAEGPRRPLFSPPLVLFVGLFVSPSGSVDRGVSPYFYCYPLNSVQPDFPCSFPRPRPLPARSGRADRRPPMLFRGEPRAPTPPASDS